MSEKRRIAVLFGGRSAEHEISCITARYVVDALDPERNEVILIGITKQGRWHRLSDPPALPAETGVLPVVTDAAANPVVLAGATGSRELVSSDGSRERIDVVFPLVHGPMGEDGTVQGLLELAGTPYVGAGVLGSAVGMDKAFQKVLFAAAGLLVGPYEVIREPEWREDPEGVTARVSALGYPVFAKPSTLGSSVGISKAHGPEELEGAMDTAFAFARKVVVEKGFEGVREIECAVLGNDDPVASTCGEITPRGHEFYDYAAKYLDAEGADLTIPAHLSPEMLASIQRMAVTAFQAVECWGMARVDFFLTSEGQVHINEINTIPGFTSISMYPKLWEASGLAYADLIDRLLDLAQERHAAEEAKSTSAGELAR
jgi:D-alanine-D-alanine ligase